MSGIGVILEHFGLPRKLADARVRKLLGLWMHNPNVLCSLLQRYFASLLHWDPQSSLEGAPGCLVFGTGPLGCGNMDDEEPQGWLGKAAGMCIALPVCFRSNLGQ